MNSYILEIGKKAKLASIELMQAGVKARNSAIRNIATFIKVNESRIFEENQKDLDQGRLNNLSEALLDRLELNSHRIDGMVAGLNRIADFEDPIGECSKSWRHENGMQISKVSVPLGVIGMIYESRPNVTVDVSGLSIKSGNCVILRGGSEAINTNKVLKDIIRDALIDSDLNPDSVQLIENTDRSLVKELITMNEYLDVLIPRGGRGLKKAIIAGATVPVIETGEGLCHTYVDQYADLKMALDIIINAKTQRTGVCNAMETLLVHESVAAGILPLVDDVMAEKSFEVRGCQLSLKYMSHGILATEDDWSTEYLDAILSIKVVRHTEEAIQHINQHGSGHSEAIVTDNYTEAEKFLKLVDASAVYVNASTRFTDGEVFGFGGEVGISTQKLHARGPMGIRDLTTTKYIVRGSGQIRN